MLCGLKQEAERQIASRRADKESRVAALRRDLAASRPRLDDLTPEKRAVELEAYRLRAADTTYLVEREEAQFEEWRSKISRFLSRVGEALAQARAILGDELGAAEARARRAEVAMGGFIALLHQWREGIPDADMEPEDLALVSGAEQVIAAFVG